MTPFNYTTEASPYDPADPWKSAKKYAQEFEKSKCETCDQSDIFVHDVSQVSEVNKILSSYDDITSVYFIGHSSASAIYVGSGAQPGTNISSSGGAYDVNPSNLDWSGLTNDAEIYIWGCHAGQGENSIAEQISNISNRKTHSFDNYINFDNGKPFVRFFRSGGPVTFTPVTSPKPIPPVSSELQGY